MAFHAYDPHIAIANETDMIRSVFVDSDGYSVDSDMEVPVSGIGRDAGS